MEKNRQKNKALSVTVVGIGYVGLSISTLLSQKYPVCVMDIDAKRVAQVNKRISPFEDKELMTFFATRELKLFATLDPAVAFGSADLVIIATPTNYDPDLAEFDTSSVETTIAQILRHRPQATILIKSTVPVGFTQTMRERYPQAHLAFSPEFLCETKALYDNLYPSRIIFGFDEKDQTVFKTLECFKTMLQTTAYRKDMPILTMSTTEAEAVKLFSNTYLAMRISFFNELDTYAEMKGLETRAIIRGVELDPRIGAYYNNPSFGYGGYCLPKDTKQLLASYDSIPQNLMKAIVDSNETRKDFIAQRILELLADKKEDAIVGIYRLTMKTDSDNFRESSIQGVLQRLQAQNIKVLIFEPKIAGETWKGYPVAKNFATFCEQAELIVANRYVKELDPVREKVYTKDIFKRD